MVNSDTSGIFFKLQTFMDFVLCNIYFLFNNAEKQEKMGKDPKNPSNASITFNKIGIYLEIVVKCVIKSVIMEQ